MSTTSLFRFRISRAPEPQNVAEQLLAHAEELLLLGDFYKGDTAVSPHGLLIPGNGPLACKLFQHPRRHLWTQDRGITTKEQLVQVRTNGKVDEDYDLDVLRMTEPRITFIHNAAARINLLPPEHRKTLLSQQPLIPPIDVTEPGVRLRAAFQSHVSDLAASLVGNSEGDLLNPSHYRFRRTREDQGSIFQMTPSRQLDLLCSFFRCFSTICQFELHDTRITCFSLTNLDDWTEPSDGEPFEVLGVLSRDCNAKCDFCYVLGNPSNSAIKLNKFTRARSSEEATVRLNYFRVGKRLPTATYDTEEIMTHPQFFELCDEIRKSSPKWISVTTNGYMINKKSVKRLAALSPVDISLSLNAADLDTRKWLMGGPAARALEVLPLLEEYNIPCAVTVVGWPRVPVEKLIEAIEYADKFNLRSISLLMGGYTKLFPNPPEYPIPGFWNQVMDAVEPLRGRLRNSLIIQPRLYELQYHFPDLIGECLITGTIPGSPAAIAGIQVYDLVSHINGVPVITRNQALAILAVERERRNNISIDVNRRGEHRTIDLRSDSQLVGYKYDRPFNDRYGIQIIGEDIRISAMKQIFQHVSTYRAKRVLFLTSMIVRPLLANALQRYSDLHVGGDVEFDLQVVPSNYLGGNIVMGDMLVADDFIDFLDTYIETHGNPDLILIPSGAFNQGGWLRDMKGQPFSLIAHCFRTPVEMIYSPHFE